MDEEQTFKKPIQCDTVEEEEPPKNTDVLKTPQERSGGNNDVPYKEPVWSGLPRSVGIDYSLEVLKSGVIIDKINLMTKAFWLFGRSNTCDVYMAHPTISRYHAVLQYRITSRENDTSNGFYIYDLASTHGTFINKKRIPSNTYIRIQVGHLLKLGCSTRTYFLLGPETDSEDESEMTITEMKQMKGKQVKEDTGVDWGMGEDADEESDLSENPFAEANNESLYIDDPKKALRHFMEREGFEINYEITERGIGQFLCSIQLPVDDSNGRPIVAEALVKGKKKEAVMQCALEACRILDRHGVLRQQSTQESRKRPTRNWEENDYYDSDEDTFLDRTGTIERKRAKRMGIQQKQHQQQQQQQQQQPLTYQTLIAKEQKLNEQMHSIEKRLLEIEEQKQNQTSAKLEQDSSDTLDQFMDNLQQSDTKPDKYTIAKLKMELQQLKKEHAETVKLVNIARPVDLPPLIQQEVSNTNEIIPSTSQEKSTPAVYGKRLKVKVAVPPTSTPSNISNDDDEEEDDDEIEEDTNMMPPAELCSNSEKVLDLLDDEVKANISKTVTKLRKIAEEKESINVDEKRLAVQKRKMCEQVNRTDTIKDTEKQAHLLNAFNKITDEYCTIGNRKLKIIDKINKLTNEINTVAVKIRAATQAHHEQAVDRMKEFVEKTYQQQTEIFNELSQLNDTFVERPVVDKLKELYTWLSEQKIQMLNNLEQLRNVQFSDNCNTELLKNITEFELKSNRFITTILTEIRKIRDAKRNKEEEETNKGKEGTGEMKQDENRENDDDEKYEMWIPPEGQTGDGRTVLNDKFGY